MNLREWALPVYTILMQFSTGTLLVLWCLRATGMKGITPDAMDRILRKPILVIVSGIVIAIVGSHFHLSKPYFSFLAIMNFGSSWLSREIVFTILLLLSCAFLAYLTWYREGHTRVKTVVGWFAVGCGCAVILCMSMLYLIPTQPIWYTPVTVLVFYSTMLMLGGASAAALLIMDTVFSEPGEPELAPVRYSIIRRSAVGFTLLASLVLVGITLLNAYQITTMRHGDQLAQTSLSLLMGVYSPLLLARFATVIAGVGLLGITLLRICRTRKPLVEVVFPIHLAVLLVVIGEILGRFLFYATHVRIGV